jgi:hypothetical protein
MRSQTTLQRPLCKPTTLSKVAEKLNKTIALCHEMRQQHALQAGGSEYCYDALLAGRLMSLTQRFHYPRSIASPSFTTEDFP